MSDRRSRTRPPALPHSLFAVLAMGLFMTAALLAGTPAAASDLRANVSFDPSDLRVRETDAGAEVSLAGLPSAGGETEPALPMAVRTFIVPEGFEVGEVRVTPRGESRIAEGVRLSLRGIERVSPDGPDEPSAATARPWPAGAIEIDAPRLPARSGVSLGSGMLAGHRVHSVALFPVRWDRETGDVFLASSVDVDLELVSARASAEGDLVRQRRNPSAERAWTSVLRGMVANPQDVPTDRLDGGLTEPRGFIPTDIPSLDGTAVDFVIVTPADLESEFQTLADWKTKKGTPTTIRTVEWIDSNYPAGFDRAERIRLFLKDAYAHWGTYLVLMGGDFTDVPPRMAYNRFFFGGKFIPTDQYYACLEGDWNGDKDQYYGEGDFQSVPGDSVDLYPDVFIGRAPVESPAEAAVFVAKSLVYDKTPPVDYVEDVCYLAEVLFPSDWHFGDPVESITLDGSALTDSFDLFIPPSWTRTKCYQVTDTLDRGHALARLSAGRAGQDRSWIPGSRSNLLGGRWRHTIAH